MFLGRSVSLFPSLIASERLLTVSPSVESTEPSRDFASQGLRLRVRRPIKYVALPAFSGW